MKLKTQLRTKIPTPKLRIPKIPSIPIIPPLFKLRGRKSFKRRGIRRLGREDIAITEGFTAKILQFKPTKIKVSDVPRESGKLKRAIGIRRAPILVR